MFTKSAQLAHHITIHANVSTGAGGEELLSCEMCCGRFTHLAGLQEHTRVVHDVNVTVFSADDVKAQDEFTTSSVHLVQVKYG